MKEFLILLVGINYENEAEEFENIIVLANDSEEANKKADKYLENYNDELCWDVEQCTELRDIPRI